MIKIKGLVEQGDILIDIEERPGPTALLRRAQQTYTSEHEKDADLSRSAGLVVRFAKKIENQISGGTVTIEDGVTRYELDADPLTNEEFEPWLM